MPQDQQSVNHHTTVKLKLNQLLQQRDKHMQELKKVDAQICDLIDTITQ